MYNSMQGSMLSEAAVLKPGRLPGDKASCTSKEQCGRDDIYGKQKNREVLLL